MKKITSIYAKKAQNSLTDPASDVFGRGVEEIIEHFCNKSERF